MKPPPPTGFRRITPGIHSAMSLADQWGTQTAIEKRRAVLAFNKVSSLLRLPSQAIELMNKLLSFSAERDWRADSRPLIWPDNQRLLAQVSFAKASLQRNLRALAEVGLIAFKDSANGKRFGKRDGSGKILIDSTYGIDLSPLALRTPILEAIAAEEEARQLEIRKLARLWTCNRRMLVGIIEAGRDYEIPGPWEQCSEDLERLSSLRRGRCDLEQLTALCEALEAL